MFFTNLLFLSFLGSQGQSPDSSPPLSRVCKIKKSEEGYGFQLYKNSETLQHVVSSVIPESQADQAGLQNGDPK